jgi:hypothetical protein
LINVLIRPYGLVAARQSALPELTRRFASWHFAIGFCVAMRATVAEAISEFHVRAKVQWEIICASDRLSTWLLAEEQASALQRTGHALVLKNNSRHLCTNCGISRSLKQWPKWFSHSCAGTDTWNSGATKATHGAKVPKPFTKAKPSVRFGHRLLPHGDDKWICIDCGVIAAAATFKASACDITQGPQSADRRIGLHRDDFASFKDEQKRFHKQHAQAKNIIKVRGAAVASLAAAAVKPLASDACPSDSVIPPWHARVHPTHVTKHV